MNIDILQAILKKKDNLNFLACNCDYERIITSMIQMI